MDANSRGSAVILCGHSNTERGFLPVFQAMLLGQLEGVEILVSKADRDPINIVWHEATAGMSLFQIFIIWLLFVVYITLVNP